MMQFGDAGHGHKSLVSVACAVRSANGCTKGALESYLGERSPDSKLIVFDNASTDGTWKTRDRHRDIVAWAVSNGIYDAGNEALSRCRDRDILIMTAGY